MRGDGRRSDVGDDRRLPGADVDDKRLAAGCADAARQIGKFLALGVGRTDDMDMPAGHLRSSRAWRRNPVHFLEAPIVADALVFL